MTPGWYPDPTGRYELRWHNGQQWTADVAVAGQRYVDPLPRPPSAPGAVGVGGPAPAGNGLAVAALVLGVIALVTAWMPFLFVIGFVLAVLALVFGILARRRTPEAGGRRSFAVAGTVLGAVALPLAIGGLVLTIVVVRTVEEVIDPGPYTADIATCEVVEDRAVVDGTIRNDGDEAQSYTLHIQIERAGTDNVLDEDLITVQDVRPGDTVPFATELPVRTERISCRLEVYGEMPFDLGG